MANYFRITAYHKSEDISVILDSYGYFEKLWQFSAFLISKGFKIYEVGSSDKFRDGNFEKAKEDNTKIFLRACCQGAPEQVDYELDGEIFKAAKVKNKIYIPQ